eukprot:scaffold571_cov364-Prasinococcus_capsulatus_cf.AAC.2
MPSCNAIVRQDRCVCLTDTDSLRQRGLLSALVAGVAGWAFCGCLSSAGSSECMGTPVLRTPGYICLPENISFPLGTHLPPCPTRTPAHREMLGLG